MYASACGVVLEIPPFLYLDSNSVENGGHCVVGSLTGVVASKKVTEAFKGTLSMVGNHTQSVMAQGCLTVRLTSRTGSKDGHSDPVILYGWVIAQRIKGTPGITG